MPGLVRECEEFLEDLQIHEDPSCFSNSMWKKRISTAIHLKNKKELLLMLDSYRKLDKEKIREEVYGQKSYLKSMKMDSARTFFSARASMLSTVKANFKGDAKFAADNYMCECREHVDTQADLLNCRLYERHREGLDLLNNDHHLVKYYRLVIKERREKEENLP